MEIVSIYFLVVMFVSLLAANLHTKPIDGGSDIGKQLRRKDVVPPQRGERIAPIEDVFVFGRKCFFLITDYAHPFFFAQNRMFFCTSIFVFERKTVDAVVKTYKQAVFVRKLVVNFGIDIIKPIRKHRAVHKSLHRRSRQKIQISGSA